MAGLPAFPSSRWSGQEAGGRPDRTITRPITRETPNPKGSGGLAALT
jgi:hypothetical protein